MAVLQATSTQPVSIEKCFPSLIARWYLTGILVSVPKIIILFTELGLQKTVVMLAPSILPVSCVPVGPLRSPWRQIWGVYKYQDTGEQFSINEYIPDSSWMMPDCHLLYRRCCAAIQCIINYHACLLLQVKQFQRKIIQRRQWHMSTSCGVCDMLQWLIEHWWWWGRHGDGEILTTSRWRWWQEFL